MLSGNRLVQMNVFNYPIETVSIATNEKNVASLVEN